MWTSALFHSFLTSVLALGMEASVLRSGLVTRCDSVPVPVCLSTGFKYFSSGSTGWASLIWKSETQILPKSKMFWTLTWIHKWKIPYLACCERQGQSKDTLKTLCNNTFSHMHQVYRKHRWVSCLGARSYSRDISYIYANVAELGKIQSWKYFWYWTFWIRHDQHVICPVNTWVAHPCSHISLLRGLGNRMLAGSW